MSEEKYFYFIVNSINEHQIEKLMKLVPKYTNHFQIFAVDNIPELNLLFTRLKEKLLQEEDVVVCVGGDGTLNHTITQMRNNHIENPVAFVPGGTGNDFARSNDIPLHFDSAIQYIFEEAKVTERNILELTGPNQHYYAVNSAGIGLDGQIIHRLEERRKKREIKARSYSNAIISTFLQLEPFELKLTVNNEVRTFDHVQICSAGVNRYLGGGIPLYSLVDHSEDAMNLVIGRKVNFSKLLKILAKVVQTKQVPSSSNVIHEKVQSYTFESNKTQCGQYDGETFMVHPGETWNVNLLKQKYWL